MLGPEYLSGTLADDDARSHRISGRYARQDRAICNTKISDSEHLEFAVNDRHLVSSHFGGTGHVPVARGRISDEPFQFSTFQASWQDFAFYKRAQRGRVANLTAELHACNSGLPILWVGQSICLDLDGISRVATGQTKVTSALRMCHGTEQCPPCRRQAKSRRVLLSRLRNFSLASKQIWTIQSRLAFPEEDRLRHCVARWQCLPVFPHTIKGNVVLN